MPVPSLAQRRLRNLDDLSLQVWKVRPFTETYNALTAVRLVAVPQRPLGLVTGPAGSGKTFTAEIFARNEANVVIVTVPPRDILTPRLLLDEFARSIDIEPSSMRFKSQVFAAIIDRLAEQDTFTIMDESDRLKSSNADMLREIAETAGRPLCFLGCPATEAILARVPATHHRIGFRHFVRPCELEDVQAALVGRALDPAGRRKLDEPTVNSIYEATRGNPRHMESLIHLLRGALKRDGTPIEISPAAVSTLNRRFQRAA